jgi:DNA-binding protein H-NS
MSASQPHVSRLLDAVAHTRAELLDMDIASEVKSLEDMLDKARRALVTRGAEYSDDTDQVAARVEAVHAIAASIYVSAETLLEMAHELRATKDRLVESLNPNDPDEDL